jgi:preprotein translocase subunit SecE
MSTRKKLFVFVTNLLGVNFTDFKLSVCTFLLFHAAINASQIYLAMYYPIFVDPWYYGHGVYDVIQVYQSMVPTLLQNYLVYRAFSMRTLQKEIEADLQPKFTQKFHKCELNFFFRLSLVVSARALKYICSRTLDNVIFHAQGTFAEFIYCSNDLMFVYYIELLIEYLEFIDLKVQMVRSKRDMRSVKHEIVKVFWTKRKIEKRYSFGVLLTVTFHFLITIISFYWSLMRLIFNHLKKINQIATFLHFIVPFVIYWLMFSRCEMFMSKVRWNIVVFRLILSIFSPLAEDD